MNPPRSRAFYLALAAGAAATLACTCSLLNRVPGLGELITEPETAIEEAAEDILPELKDSLEGEPGGESGGSGEGDEGPSSLSQAAGPGLPAQIAEGALELQVISATSEDTVGRVLKVQVLNRTSSEVVTTVPCGLVFQPADNESQRLMTIQPDTATLPADGSATLEPLVVCIDSSKSAPSIGGTYSLGTIAAGELLQLAECLCEEPLDSEDFMQLFGVQMAVWSVSDGFSFSDMLESDEEIEGAAGEFLSGEMAELIEGIMGFMQEPAGEWLERCGIEIQS